MKYIYYYLIAINIITFFTYGLDKCFAKKNKRRISEKTLLTLSSIGGCYLGLFAMYTFHHKTLKMKFKIINVLGIIIYTIILIKIFALK